MSYSARASYEREHLNYALTERTASRIEGLYQRYRSDELAYWLAHGTHPKVWALGSQEKFQATEAEIERIEQLVDTHDDERLPRLLGWYYRNEVYNRVGAERSVEVEQTLDRLTTFYESYAEWESVPEYYADALRSAVKFYFEQENFEAAEQKLELITTLTDTHDPTETAVSSRYARALARGVEANVERGEIDTAMAYYDRIRELVDDDNDVGSPLTEATKALADRILAAENLDELERIVTDLWSVVEASTDRFVAAELQTRANLTRGHWWPDDGEFQVTIEEETASTVTVSVSDQYELEHVITVGTDGSVSTNTGEGDIPETIGDLSPFQQQLAQFVRGYAAYWLDREHDVDVLSPESKPESIEAVSKAIAELSTEEVDELFGEYLAQHASHWNDTAPFVDEVKRPVDPVGIDLENEVVLYEVWVSIEDGTVAGVSDIQIAVLDDDERTVLREASVPDGETYALVSLPVRFVVTPELLQLVMGEHLRCQCRDRYVALGMEPPVESRILGPGQQSLTSLYTEYDSVPDFHNPEANVAGYEPGTAPEMLVAKHIQNVLYEDVAWARDVLDHLEGTPTTAPIPPTITAPTNTWRGDQ
ncbi:hypothetical protein [Natronobiforma cellulositropha]|uniref:hypothetical protein n=1 Tax=Natronobiforma cellulositropha TaxID=1679076 RepID=UPI0021D5D764|nr:hypothetical protein [Natronobiforma cellulositropha]